MIKKSWIGAIPFLLWLFLYGYISAAELKSKWFIRSKCPSSVVVFPGIKEGDTSIWIPQYLLSDFRTYILKVEAGTGKVSERFLIKTNFGKLIGFYGKVFTKSGFLILPCYVKNYLWEYPPPMLAFWNIKERKMKVILSTFGHIYNSIDIGENILCLWTTSNEIFLIKVIGDEIYIRKFVTYSPFPSLSLEGKIYQILREGFIERIVGGNKNGLLLLSKKSSYPHETILVKIEIKGHIWLPQKWLKLGEGMWVTYTSANKNKMEGYYLNEAGVLKILDLQVLKIKMERQIFKRKIQIIDAISCDDREKIITVISYPKVEQLELGEGKLTAETYSLPYLVVIDLKTFQIEWSLPIKGEIRKPALSAKGGKVFFWVYNREKAKSYLYGVDIEKKKVLFCEETNNVYGTVPPLVIGSTLITLWKPSEGSKEQEGYKAFEIP